MAGPRNHRWRRIGKWVGLFACLLILAAWAVGLWSRSWTPIGDRGFLVCSRQGLFVGVSEATLLPPLDAPFFAWQEWEGFAFEAPERVDALGATVLFVPFWLLFLVAALPTAFLFHRDRRRIRAGYCRHCDYDLRGIASGICPECGNACPVPSNPPDMPPPPSEKSAKA
ncbi:MAG: hypothetical protein IPK83_06115 [Planctomycetes bacterium]|nr:hypothetical protein [Planctomycetota bacterium]